MNRVLYWLVLSATAAILGDQLLIPPVIGMADQNDFKRTIGKFGYGPEPANLSTAFVAPKYVRNPNYRVPTWEHLTSEYLFTEAAVVLNRILPGDGRLDIRLMGFLHGLAFLVVFARLLWVTRRFQSRALIWLGAAFILTDAGYAAYWNSFYTEPASFLFCLLLLSEAVAMGERGEPSPAEILRWSVWAVLFAMAKPQDAVVGVVLGLFTWSFFSWTKAHSARIIALAGGAVILATSCATMATAPAELKNANTYNIVFLSILPESRNPSADLVALGLDPKLRDYSRTGAWSLDTIYPTLENAGVIGKQVTLKTTTGFYLARPARLWRHIQSLLPVAVSLYPDCCGNFEPSAGHPPGAMGGFWRFWSWVHGRVLARVDKFLLFGLVLGTLWALWMGIIRRQRSLWREFYGLLTVCCLIAFLAAAFGDAWDNIKHLFLFNLLLDAVLLSSAAGLAARFLARRANPRSS